ncbi:MAG: hypothetical protein E6Q29_07445 [Alicycliphilus sp.]|nr:MAG: hypothetical protein E6Q29_07445 [Alicycliphilus sp.]
MNSEKKEIDGLRVRLKETSVGSSFYTTEESSSVGGFFIDVHPLEFPVFLRGAISDYDFFIVGTGKIVCWSSTNGVLVIDGINKSFSRSRMWSDRVLFEDDQLVFLGEGYGVLNDDQERTLVRIADGALSVRTLGTSDPKMMGPISLRKFTL